MEVLQKRNLIKEYIKKQVIGPVNGEDEEINEDPWLYYISGVLFPINAENRNNEIYKKSGFIQYRRWKYD